jgi:hypothetical protein
MGAITMNSNSNITLLGTGKIDQSTGTGVNLMGAITLNSNSNITLVGTGIISQPGTSSQNIFSTLRFNNSSSNKQITMFQNSATNLATNYTISIESPSIQRYNAGSAGSHYFSVGTGVSTYTNYAIINSSGLTLLGNMTQTTTSIIDQSSSTGGINLLKAITMNAGTNLTQTTTSIIDQSSSTGGVNLLKAITMNAGTNLTQTTTSIIDQSSSTGGVNLLKAITMNAGTNLTQKDSTNAVYTTLGQANTSTYLIENNYNSSEIRLRNKNASGGSVDYVFAYGGATFYNTLYFENNNVIAFRSGANQTNLGQSGTSFVCENTTNSNSIILRAKNSSGTSIDAITTDYNNTTIANNLVCNTTATITGQLTLQSNTNLPTMYTAPTAGQLGYIKFGSASTPSPNPFNLVVLQVFNLASILLPAGVWNVFGQGGFYINTGGTIRKQYISISSSNSLISTQCMTSTTGMTTTTSDLYIQRINEIVVSNGSILPNIFLNINVDFTSGVYQITTYSQSFTQFYAVRIA